MVRRHRPLTASTATAHAASLRLFGDAFPAPHAGSHRGYILRYVLRSIYGADYRKRGAKLLSVSPARLSDMMSTGSRVSRRAVQRLEHALRDRKRHRYGELRVLSGALSEAFAAEVRALERTDELLALLARAASAAANTRNPHSSETGRFVRRDQSKLPVLSEPGLPLSE